MRRSLATALLLTIACVICAHAAEVVTVGRWELHNSFWMSLHQTLIDDAMRKTPRALDGLAADEQTIWRDAVAAYRTAGGDMDDLSFARPMVITNDALTQIADDALTPEIDAPLGETLRKAAPVYRKHWWSADEKANRFFIAYAAGMLRDAGEELVRAHEKVYGAPWPARIRAFVSPYAGPFGAYTMSGRAGGVITTMSHRDPGYRGLNALEMMLHEGSHAIVGPNNGRVAEAIRTAAKKRNIDPPRDLWHAILFATTSELTRRALADRGVPDFIASDRDLLTRAWPKYREPIEKHWFPYVRGEGTLEEAMDRVVDAIHR